MNMEARARCGQPYSYSGDQTHAWGMGALRFVGLGFGAMAGFYLRLLMTRTFRVSPTRQFSPAPRPRLRVSVK